VGSGFCGGGCAAVASPFNGGMAEVVELTGCLECSGVSWGADMLEDGRGEATFLDKEGWYGW
jgi:hypothetical protein